MACKRRLDGSVVESAQEIGCRRPEVVADVEDVGVDWRACVGQRCLVTSSGISSAFSCVPRRALQDVDGGLRGRFGASSLRSRRTSLLSYDIFVSDGAAFADVVVPGWVYHCLGVARDLAHGMPALVQLAGAVLSSRLHSWMASVLVPVSLFFIAALPREHSLDPSHAAHLIRQKAMDRRSCGGMAQVDDGTYCDTFGVVRIVRCMCRAGLPFGLASASLRARMLPRVELRVCCVGGAIPVEFVRRAWGFVTGIRLAGALGRWPTEMAARTALDPQPRAGCAAGSAERANTFGGHSH